MTSISRSRRVSPLKEACSLCRSRHYVAAAAMAKLAVDHAASDLALQVRPDLKRFWNGKRLNGFLRSEGAIDGKRAAELSAFAMRAYQLMNEPTGRPLDVQQLIVRAADLRRRLREIQRGM